MWASLRSGSKPPPGSNEGALTEHKMDSERTQNWIRALDKSIGHHQLLVFTQLGEVKSCALGPGKVLWRDCRRDPLPPRNIAPFDHSPATSFPQLG